MKGGPDDLKLDPPAPLPLSRVLRLEFQVHHWGTLTLGRQKAGLGRGRHKQEINREPFLSHCGGASRCWAEDFKQKQVVPLSGSAQPFTKYSTFIKSAWKWQPDVDYSAAAEGEGLPLLGQMAEESGMTTTVHNTRQEAAIPWGHHERHLHGPGALGQITRARVEAPRCPVGTTVNKEGRKDIWGKYFRQRAQWMPTFCGAAGLACHRYGQGPVWQRSMHPGQPHFLSPPHMPFSATFHI